MSEYDKLKEEFDQKVRELQDRCKHEKSEWITDLDRWGEKREECLNCRKVWSRETTPKYTEEDRKRFEKEMEWIRHSGAMVDDRKTLGEEMAND